MNAPYRWGRFRRIGESFELERIPKGHPIRSLCDEQGHLQLYRVAPSPVQPDPGFRQMQVPRS